MTPKRPSQFFGKNRPAISPRQEAEGLLRAKRYLDVITRTSADPALHDLLVEAVLGRAREYRQSGRYDKAAETLRRAAALIKPAPGVARRLAIELASCGGVAEALALWPTGEDPLPLYVAAADLALFQGKIGRATLPAEMHEGFDAVMLAFREYEAGHYDEARTVLNAIGLRSPFQDWKLLIRGLIAWSVNDDPKALENWQRLAPTGLPAQLIAPLRADLDPAWRDRQPAGDPVKLHKQRVRLLGDVLGPSLRRLQAELASNRPIDFIRQAETLITRFKTEGPQIVPKLVHTISAAMVRHGELGEVDRLARFMPAPADDPTFDRLKALLCEDKDDPVASIRYWRAYEQVLANRPQIFGDATPRARALVWAHIGQLECDLRFEPPEDSMSPFDDFVPQRPRRKPPKDLDPAASFDRAIELTPDLLEALEGPVRLAVETKDVDLLFAAGDRLLALHPNHVSTLASLKMMCDAAERPVEGLKYAEALLALDPLNSSLRQSSGVNYRRAARINLLAGDDATARAQLAAAVELSPESAAAAHAILAAVALRDGNAEEAEKHLALAGKSPGELALRMIAEVAYFKLHKSVKARFEPVLKTTLAGSHELSIVLALVEVCHNWMTDRRTYHGQKTHVKKVETLLKGAAASPKISESELERACTLARECHWTTTALRLSQMGEWRFEKNPHFSLVYGLANMDKGPRSFDWAENAFYRAKARLEALPAERRPAGMAEQIQAHLAVVGSHSPLAGIFGRFEQMFGEKFGDFDP